MSCFPSKKELFLEFHDVSDGRDETIQCNCLQNCLESNVSLCLFDASSTFNFFENFQVIVEKFQVLKGTKQLLGSIGGLLIMKKYPLIRFQREVIFTLTDFFGA